jgi:hypothetical protein
MSLPVSPVLFASFVSHWKDPGTRNGPFSGFHKNADLEVSNSSPGSSSSRSGEAQERKPVLCSLRDFAAGTVPDGRQYVGYFAEQLVLRVSPHELVVNLCCASVVNPQKCSDLPSAQAPIFGSMMNALPVKGALPSRSERILADVVSCQGLPPGGEICNPRTHDLSAQQSQGLYRPRARVIPSYRGGSKIKERATNVIRAPDIQRPLGFVTERLLT